MIRKKKKFAWPRKIYDKPRILDENQLVEKYGLKNKKEIWKTEAKVKYFRTRAKQLITADSEEQQNFFSKLRKMGLKVNSIADVLALTKEDVLKRRLSNVLFDKKLANTPKHARQMIVHKRVLISNKAINSPSYIVNIEEENLISLKPSIVKTKKENNQEESLNEQE